jgi:hypothetical protein
MLAAIVEASPLSAAQKWELWQSRFAGLGLIRDGSRPSKMLGDATADFTAALQVAAAREQALRQGLPWDELKPDPDSDEADTPLVFSSSDGDGWRG